MFSGPVGGLIAAIIAAFVAAVTTNFINGFMRRRVCEPGFAAGAAILVTYVSGAVCDIAFGLKGWTLVLYAFFVAPAIAGAVAIVFGLCYVVYLISTGVTNRLARLGERTREQVQEYRFHRDLEDEDRNEGGHPVENTRQTP
jgi:hypothetical protein